MEQNQDKRRGHFHRGRRGPDRRNLERRGPTQAQERQPPRDQVDVEQIMREIRGRVAQRQGVELTADQIQDLAVRRLESILDPRSIKPSLLEALRRNAGAVPPTIAPKASTEPAYSFEDTTLYDSHRSVLRFFRKLLNPLLKLFFNPNPLIRALHLQARLNVDAAAREAERERQQAEWNALHYEIVQRLVAEISRVSIEVQALSTKADALAGRVDFNDRKVRNIEGATQPARPASRAPETAPPRPPESAAPGEGATATEASPAEVARRRRRRRRGRRGSMGLPAQPGQEHREDLGLDAGQQDAAPQSEDSPFDGGTEAPTELTGPSHVDERVEHEAALPAAPEPIPAHEEPRTQPDSVASDVSDTDPWKG